MKIYRQGDVLLREVRSIPKDAKHKQPKERIVLAYGEVTGHAHAIHDLENVDVFIGANGEMYLGVKRDVALEHEEHATITLPPGNYERVLQREYEPQGFRNVAD